ncbi:nuclear transport factor 2 family protein [Streptosporangium sp. NPDC051023]|uniref:ester cyclase n=1 Tax=Streptosporangium sp. NPDC051023 TaxID=3155410 RepID=UPI00344D08A8
MTDVVNLVHDFFAVYNAHDLDALARYYAQNAVSVSPGGQGESRDEILSYHVQFWEAFPDVHNTTLQAIAQDDDVAVTALITGTHTGPFLLPGGTVVSPTGRRVHLRCCWIFTLEAGLIVTHLLYWDQLEAYAQLGFLPQQLNVT